MLPRYCLIPECRTHIPIPKRIANTPMVNHSSPIPSLKIFERAHRDSPARLMDDRRASSALSRAALRDTVYLVRSILRTSTKSLRSSFTKSFELILLVEDRIGALIFDIFPPLRIVAHLRDQIVIKFPGLFRNTLS